MEKYTIDIDKVLDEFEETEALKVHADKKSENCVIEHHLTPNCSTNSGEKNAGNSWDGTAFDINASQLDKSKTLSEIERISDISSISSSQGNNRLLDEHSSQCSLDKETNFSGTNKVATSLNQVDVHYDDEINTRHLSYDIFYKPRESAAGSNANHLQSLNCVPESFSDEFGLGDYSPDEILCVSVEENKPEVSFDESQEKNVESHSVYNSVQSNDFASEENQSNPNILNHGVHSSTREGTLLDFQNSETKSTDTLTDSDKLPYLTQSSVTQICRPNQLSLNTVPLSESLIDEAMHISENALPSPLNFYSQTIKDMPMNVTEFVSQNVKMQCDDSRALEDCSNHIACDDNLIVCNNSASHNFDVQDIQLGNENVIGVFVPEVPRNALDLQNGFNVQDDDSGVSSTEDISGNSPPQMNSEPENSVVNENCDIGMTFSNMESCGEDSSFPDITNHVENFENSDMCCLSTCTVEETKQGSILLNHEESTSLMKSGVNVTTTIANGNNGSKTSYSNQNNCGYVYNAEASISSNEEFAFCGDSVVETTINSNISVTTNNENTENPIQYSSASPMATNFTDSQNSNNSKERENFSKKDIEQNLMDEETVECTEDLNLLDTNDCISPRLQRPTTLDLPSLIIASPSITEETLAPSNSNVDPAITADNLNATSVEPISSEMIPYVKQQPQIGIVKPYWIPDAEALNCMHCGMKFTVLKRRHHCRGCGKVLCSRCCNQKAFLTYLNKEDRICQPCADVLASTLQNDQIPVPFDSQSSSSCGSSPNFSPSPQNSGPNYADKALWRPHPNNPDDYCSTIPPLQQIQSTEARPPPTVMVPIGNKPRKEPKQVIFSDGIRPGGDLTDLTEPAETAPVYRRFSRKRVDKLISGDSKLGTGSLSPMASFQKNRQKRIIVSDEEGPLPPVVLKIGSETDEKMDWNTILQKIQDDNQKAVNFALMKNMHLFVKITKLDCCFGNECWCFTSHGLCTVGQDEVMLILERLPGEKAIPRDIFKLFSHVYDSASKGSTFDDLGHIIFPEQILGSSDHRGFLFVRPTFQCLSKLTVPNTPYLVAILIHKWEVPWAKVFPIRLMLRLGAECRYYPCSLVSVRHRKPVYFEIGQTIMSVLTDLRNFQFTIPVIAGLVVHMEEKKTCVNIPRNRYEKVMKILNNNNVEHVLALGSNFSTEADSHLVCMQKEEGDYQTQAINIENTTRKVTGASFIIFSGALKSSSGLSAKFSIVEDGLLIQISQDTMVALHMALRDMKDLTIQCGQINAEPEEIVILQWARDDKKFNIGVLSPIDGKSFEGVHNLRIHSATDYAGENYLIRWTEVFFLDVDENSRSIQNELVDPCRLAETVAQSCCMALTPYLDQLAESELTKLGLRVTLDSQSDRVEYDIGARGKALPSLYMNALDSGLIPVILRLSSSTHSEKLSFELIFHILIK